MSNVRKLLIVLTTARAQLITFTVNQSAVIKMFARIRTYAKGRVTV